MISRQDIYLHLFLLSFLRKCSAVTVTVDDVDVAEGSEARITCNIVPASSPLDPAVTWYNVKKGVDDAIATYQSGFGTIEPRYSDRFSVENDITLVINNTLRSDSGTYKCDVTLVGDIPSTDDDICTLTVNYFESGNVITIDVNDKTIAHNVTITCSGTVGGVPAPDINLYRDNTVIKTQTTLPLTYMIDTVSEDDGGMYRCEASNNVGSNTITLDYYLTGTITISSTSNDTTIILTCSGSVDGNPSPDIVLYKDGDIILQQFTLPLTYTISSVTGSDVGHYTCQANNTAFSTRSSVLELYKPILEEDTVGPGEKYVITFYVEANPQDVTYVWSIDGVVDPDANSATFTFTASMKVGTVHEITVIATNIIGSTKKTMRITVSATNIESTTNSAKTTMPCTTEPSNSNTGLIIGMLFVGIIIGAIGFYIGEIILNKIRKKSLSEKQNTDKAKQDTYMDYVGDTGGQNQTYQDLQHKVEESAYVNVKAGNKNKGKV